MMPEFGLGRIHAPDKRDRNFALPRPAQASGIEYRYWITTAQAFDQGNTSQCVSYAWQRFLTTNPIKNRPLPFAEFYAECQRNDEWSGEEPDYEGTSVRAGAKCLKARGLVSEYRWAWDAETVIAHVLAVGPVVMGTTWTWDMFYPDPKGFLHVTGQSVGGHAWTIIGASRTRQAVRAINSWGPEWGPHKGRFWLSFADLNALIRDDGEACVAMEVRQ